MKFSAIKDKIKNNPGFKSLKEIKEGGYRIVKERDGNKYFLARQGELKPLLVKLGDIAEVKFGIKTGANEFFYLDEERLKEWKIEKEFLKPIIKSPRECKSILIKASDLKFKVFMCHKDKKDLKGTNALKYIEWGEESKKDTEGKEIGQFHKRPSCRGRQKWWECPELKGNMFWVKETNDRLGAFISKEFMLCDCRLYYTDGSIGLQNSYNSTLTALISEVLSRVGLGEGAKSLMVYEVNDMLVLNPSVMKSTQFLMSARELKSIFTELGINPNLPIRDQKPNPLPDRKTLDDVVFDIIGLTQEERDEMYWAVCELVKNRLEKARSV